MTEEELETIRKSVWKLIDEATKICLSMYFQAEPEKEIYEDILYEQITYALWEMFAIEMKIFVEKFPVV